MNGILNLDFMHYTTVISLEMSDEPKKLTEAARPEGAEALSPGQRPGYNGNGQGALNQRSPAHSGKVKGKSFKIHLTQLSQIGKFKKLKPYALKLNIQTIRLLS